VLKKIVFAIVFLVFSSCDYFEKKKEHATEDRVQQRLEKLDTSKIDRFPIFKDCEGISNDAVAEKECFILSLSSYISNSLFEHKLVLENELDNTFQVAVEVSDLGKISIKSFEIDSILKVSIKNIEGIIEQSINELPEIKPALKKIHSGEEIPVKTQFIIPIRVVAKITPE
tara:strand:+ start:298 stop:810 length:513 start_codon:yes stop_codon:yes gene_type:complete